MSVSRQRALAALACAALSCASERAREEATTPRRATGELAALSAGDEPPSSLLPVVARVEGAPPAHAATRPVASLAFVGDVAMILQIAAHLDGKDPPGAPLPRGYPFHAVAERLRSYDLLVGNLECLVTQAGAKRTARTLNASLATPRALLDAGFDAVSIANNHTLDRSWPGYFDMIERLEAAGLPHAGALGAEEREAELILEVKGIKVAIVGQFLREPARALADVERAEKKADVTIVFLHWGAEYQVEVLEDQRALARALIDHGADAIVGAHPHVVQPDELYQGKLIAYSLGNFVFPQMWKPGTSNGALLELDVDQRGVVGHRYLRVALDPGGAPAIVGEPLAAPPLAEAHAAAPGARGAAP